MPSKSIPRYCLHKGSGQAYVKLSGKRHYLGVHGTPASHREYARLIGEWQAGQTTAPKQITTGQLAMLYLQHAEKHYRKAGQQTTEVSAIQTALRHVNRLHRKTSAADFTPKMLRAVRDSMIESGYVRKSINKLIDRIRRMHKWAVSEGLVHVNVYQALLTLSGLQRGRTDAREGRPVRPVPDALVDAVQPYVSREVWGMIEVQRVTGMRPSEVRLMRAIDLNMQGEVWEYVPAKHKTEHHVKRRIVMIGPKGQTVLKEFLRADITAYIFSPDGEGKRPYRRDSYRNAIVRGCELAFGMLHKIRRPDAWLTRQDGLTDGQRMDLRKKLLAEAGEWRRENCWSPNRLRHNFGTEARRAGGIEAARVTLGHASAVTSEIYAEKDMDAARAVVTKIG